MEDTTKKRVGRKMERYSADVSRDQGFDLYTLRDRKAGAEASIVPAIGSTCVGFRRLLRDTWVDLIEPAPDLDALQANPSGHGTPVLFPFPNRVRRGRYAFESKEYEFEEKKKSGNSIHGLVFTRPWKVESARSSTSDAALTCAFHLADFPGIRKQYPFPHELRLVWTLTGGSLLLRVMVRNSGKGRMPMGFGLHPYFSAPFFEDTPRSECLVTVPAEHYWELEDSLPTGKVRRARGLYDLRRGKPLEGMSFDDVFTGLDGGVTRCIVDDTSKKVRLVIESGPEFREIVVFTPPRRNTIAIEPYTCTTDAVNLESRGIDAGLLVLDPGEEFTGSIKISAEEY